MNLGPRFNDSERVQTVKLGHDSDKYRAKLQALHGGDKDGGDKGPGDLLDLMDSVS